MSTSFSPALGTAGTEVLRGAPAWLEHLAVAGPCVLGTGLRKGALGWANHNEGA